MAVSLSKQAERDALGGDAVRPVDITTAGPYRRGIVDEVRVRSYYPPTRELLDVTPIVKDITWSHVAETAGKTGAISVDNADGDAAMKLLRPGLIVLVETKPPDGKFKERERFIVTDTLVDDLRSTQDLQWTLEDHMRYLHSDSTRRTWHFRKDNHHPHGWTADEIAAEVCRKLRVPTLALVKGKYRIRRLVIREGTGYDVIAKAYEVDQTKTGRHYYVEMVRGRLVVRRSRKRRLLLALDERDNVRWGQFSRTLPANFATAGDPRGREKHDDGKRRRHPKHKADVPKGKGGGDGPVRGGPYKIIGTPYSGTHTLGNWPSDNAVDIAAPIGSVIQAVGNGVISGIAGSWNGGASRFDGYSFYLKLNSGAEVWYKHMKSLTVRNGQRVTEGQALGRTGAANGVPHLHFAVHNGDPRRFLNSVRSGSGGGGGGGGGGRRQQTAVDRLNRKPGERRATAALFGELVYRPRITSIRDPDYSRKFAQDLTEKLARSKKLLRLQADGNLMIDVGDRVWVRITFAKVPMRLELFVSSIAHTITAGDHVMDLEFEWREKAVDVNSEARNEPRPQRTTTEVDKATKGGSGGTGPADGGQSCVLTYYAPSRGGINGRAGGGAAGVPLYDTSWACAAPPAYPFGTIIRFSYRGKSIDVPVLDRGSAIQGAHFDLLVAPAQALGAYAAGRVEAKFKVVGHKRVGRPGADGKRP
jgi:murein DD-endopeptidase MepM/ murein hydrolase activator NlpD